MGNLNDLSSLTREVIWEGCTGRILRGDQMTFGVLELEPNCVVPSHEHPNDQCGVLIQGSLVFTIGEESREVGPGGTWRIPGGTPHGVVTGPEGAVLAEAWAPGRSDWDLAEAPPAAPSWP